MSVNDKTENRGTHGVSSSMLDTLVSSSENPLSLDMGSVNNIKSTELCERCVYDGENCNLKCFAGEDCKMLDGDSCKCVRVPLRTPCDYFVERDNF